ncbi:ADYC domain-containing protein [Nannocystis pusilla]|uniref:ADYC domain-containing protein n=1 Tax=Nannocystis pusilla TaxID=889268 RepID=UPI003DA2B911
MTSPVARFLPVFATLSAVTPACAPEPEYPELEFRTTCGVNCPPTNSPHINDAPFPELSLSGQPNSAGVTLVGLSGPPGNASLHPLVVANRDELVVLDENGDILYSGADLVGWRVHLEKDNDLKWGQILAYNPAEPPLDDSGRPFTTYAIAFTDNTGPIFTTQNVCPTYWNEPTNPVLTIIAGETYDRDLKKVDLIDGDWVTFACKDEAAFKAKALGYEQNVEFAQTGAPATRDQQDATLKMITTDYCGTGFSFTEQNTSIFWGNTAGTVVPKVDTNDPDEVEGLEAVWDQHGAICITTPRKGDVANVQAVCEEPIPDCANVNWANMPHEWVTWKPL